MADGNLWRFHDFILGVRDDGPQGWGEPELLSLLDHNPAIVAELHDVGRPGAHRIEADQELLWGLYAMSRLTDILIAPHQPVDDDPALLAWTTREAWWSGPSPAPTAWAAFREMVGASPISEDEFHPFFHEIVEVLPDEDPDQPPALVEEHWPGALIGGLLLARSGVTVRTGTHRMEPAVAARSCMYWAWWRRNRVVRDLSHGWGHNSQWRTDFRRDYLIGDEFHYNVDRVGLDPASPADSDPDLTAGDRLDLLRYRHSVLVDLGDDRWPYHDTLVEHRPSV